MSYQESQSVIPPLSPIVDGYINTSNSEGVSEGFISSTPLILSVTIPPKSPTIFNKRAFRPTSSYHVDQNYYSMSKENTDENGMLQQILNQMKLLEVKMDKVETSVKTMQEEFADFKNEIRSRQLADNKLSRKTYCTCEMIKRKLNKITGDEMVDDNLNLMMPADNLASLSDLEAKLSDDICSSKLVSMLKSKKIKLGFDGLFRSIANDNVYFQFNLDGRCNKRSLLSLRLFKDILYQASQDLNKKEYEAELRKSILKAHNRFNKSNSLAKNKAKAAGSKS